MTTAKADETLVTIKSLSQGYNDRDHQHTNSPDSPCFNRNTFELIYCTVSGLRRWVTVTLS